MSDIYPHPVTVTLHVTLPCELLGMLSFEFSNLDPCTRILLRLLESVWGVGVGGGGVLKFVETPYNRLQVNFCVHYQPSKFSKLRSLS